MCECISYFVTFKEIVWCQEFVRFEDFVRMNDSLNVNEPGLCIETPELILGLNFVWTYDFDFAGIFDWMRDFDSIV